MIGVVRDRSFTLYFVVFVAGCLLVTISCNRMSTSNIGSQPQASTKATPTPTPHSSYDFAIIDRLLEQVARKHGGAALVLVKDEAVIYRKSFGSHAPDKVVPIASASKWLSGALIMNLVDAGKLSLDDAVSKYIPDFAHDKSNITIRQLFAHTSGLPPEIACRNNKRSTLERCVTEIARVRMRATPGEEFYYGGVSMHVGGRIAEIVGGKSFNELFVEVIATPMGMLKTDFLAYGPTGNPRPAGDARSSADDYARFLQMILQGGTLGGKKILAQSSVVEMHKDQTAGARIAYTIYQKHGGLDPALPLARYGVGLWREKVADNEQLLEASSQGALGFSPWIDVERNLAGVLSMQSSFSKALPDYLALKEEIRRIVPPDSGPSALQ